MQIRQDEDHPFRAERRNFSKGDSKQQIVTYVSELRRNTYLLNTEGSHFVGHIES